MITNQARFEEYHRLGSLTASGTASMTFDEIERVLSTPVELPDGRLVTYRDVTADDLAAIKRYMHTHAQGVAGRASLN